MDEPVPVRRAVVGCLVLALVGIVGVALVRPAIFVFGEPRDDRAVVVGTMSAVAAGPAVRDVILSRARGWAGEIDAGDGRVQLRLIVAASRFGSVAVVAGASPGRDGCPLEIGADRLTDCDGRHWTFEGEPLDSGDPPLDRFPATIDDGAIVVDLTRRMER
jgi:hypothetical protein